MSAALLDAIERVPGSTVHGIRGAEDLGKRVPTVSFTIDRVESSALAAALAAHDVGVRSGHMYAPRLMRRLGAPAGGLVRASLVHYNTGEEIARFGSILEEAVETLRPKA